MKSEIAILMGVIIFIADIAWLFTAKSYTYMPWLDLAIVIAIADIVWIAMDVSLMMDARKTAKPMSKTPSSS